MKIKFNISKRIALGYFIILFVISITSVISILLLRANKEKYFEISKIYLPSVTYLKEFDALSKEANKLIIDWIYLSDQHEKERLTDIQQRDLPALKMNIQSYAEKSGNVDLINNISVLLNDWDSTVTGQKNVMKLLATTENYSNDSLVDAAIYILEKEVKPRFENSQNYLNTVLQNETVLLKKQESEMYASYNYLFLIMLLILGTIIIVGSVSSYLATTSITKPIRSLKDIIYALGRGEMPELTLAKRDDEIGEMAKAIESMTENIKLKTEFARETGNGNYTSQFRLLSDKDVLGNALLQMRNNLQKAAEEDMGRNWINAGLAQIGEILRNDQVVYANFYSDIIVFIAEYLNASYGALFTLNEFEKYDHFLELVASYAFDMSSSKRQKIALGEGMAGQAALGKKILLLDSIPANYININSGLGETKPHSIVLVPLIFENELKGLIELATIDKVSALQLEFLEKISRNVAISFDLDKRKLNTEMLLRESQTLNEELMSSESKLSLANEELRTFIYKASHDLRGPLSTILGLINLALTEPAEKDDIYYIQCIAERADKLDRILRTLIKIMVIKEEELKKEEIDFTQTTNSILDNLRSEHNTTNLRIVANIENKRTFISDNEVLEYVLHNIIENTILFKNPSNTDSFVIIHIYDFKNGVKIDIADNGLGIDSGLKSKVFEMFFRGNAASTGLGLGLYFVKNAINKLEGKIEFNSEEGVGTLVSMFVPSLS